MENKIASQIVDYYSTLDKALERISNLKERRLAKLPPWQLTNRNIKVGITPDNKGIVIKVTPDPTLEQDVIVVGEISNNDDLNAMTAPLIISTPVAKISKNQAFMIGNMTLIPDNPLIPPPDVDKSLFAYGNITSVLLQFTKEKATEEALTYFNRDDFQNEKSGSYIEEVRNIYFRCHSMIKRKAFLERRIHRYINEYSKVLLPSHKKCYFEKDVFFGGDKRTADFILERETGLPPILVELESPVHRVFRKNLEFTSEVNHAKSQIAEWVKFIENNPLINASNDFSFLSGPKERLIIIGRGLENKKKLIDSKYTDTTIWTYDLLLEQAKERMNSEIIAQCKLLGIEILKPF